MIYKDIYRLKRVDDSDFPAIKMLFWAVFKKHVSVEYLIHKYNSDYLNLKNMSTIAYLNNTPVAFYGVILQEYISNEKNIIVAQACDSSTITSHRGKGLHFQLASLTYTFLKNNNIKLVFAFLNNNSIYSTKKLNWNYSTNLKRYHLYNTTIPLAKVLNKLNLNFLYSTFYSKKINSKRFDIINKQNKENYSQLLNTKFIRHKNSIQNHYCVELEDCFFWIKIDGIMHIGLFTAPNVQAFEKAIKKLKRKAYFLGITELLFQVDSKSPMVNLLNNICKPKESWLIGYLNFDDSINFSKFVFNYSDLDTF
jgi:hypothetical protein